MIPINKRKVGVCILLSIVTLGIYQIYWEYLLVKNIKSIKKDESSCTGEMLCLVFVPFYSLFWWFTRGKIVKDNLAEHGYSAIGNEIAYLILGIFGLSIVSMAIMQNDFNSLKSDTQSIQRSTKQKEARLPLFHITKRAAVPLWQAILVRVVAILAAMIVCAVITVIFTGDNPLLIYATIFKGAFGKGRAFVTVHDIAILLCISLAVTPAFRMRFWNTGAEGQTLIGGLATAIVMFYLHDKVPTPLLVVLMLAAGLFAGAVWGLIPAVFKAQWKTNETLFTLMMNYVAIQLVEYFLKIADKTGSNVVGPRLLGDGIPNLFGVQYLLNIVVVAVLTVLLFIYLQYSKHGYEISVVGESENTARYIGINVKKVIIRTMILSGALCGLAGFLIVGGASHSVNANIVGGRGFTAIMVSWLAKFNPLMMILTTLLLVFMGRGADEISTQFGLNKSFSDIITGIVLFFIIGCEFFIRYQVHLNRRRKEEN